MGWINDESLWLVCPALADEFIRREAFECLEPSGKVVGIDEVGEMPPKLVVAIVMVAIDGSLLDGSVHGLDLPVQ